jgi:hypothetical protein
MPTHAELLKGLAEILLSPACQYIDFSYRGFRVNGRSYRAVVTAMLDDKIHLTVLKKPLKDGAIAAYGNDSNSIFFPPNFSFSAPTAAVVIVHECTHASFDVLYAGSRLHTLYNEAMAYLAMAVFNNFAPPHMQSPWPNFKGLWTAVAKAAPNVQKGAAIDEKMMKTITNELQKDPRFRRELERVPVIEFDGV